MPEKHGYFVLTVEVAGFEWFRVLAASNGWYRFVIDEVTARTVAVYRVLGDRVPGEAALAVSRRLRGQPTLVFRSEAGARYAVRVGLLSVDPAGRFLLALTATQEMLAFDLEDPAMPRPLVRDTPIGRRHPEDPVRCTFADMRAETLTLDIFCTETAHSVRLLPDTPALRTEDTLDRFGRDAFGGDVPLFSLEPDVSASPDGRHVYATAKDEILTLRAGGKPLTRISPQQGAVSTGAGGRSAGRCLLALRPACG